MALGSCEQIDKDLLSGSIQGPLLKEFREHFFHLYRVGVCRLSSNVYKFGFKAINSVVSFVGVIALQFMDRILSFLIALQFRVQLFKQLLDYASRSRGGHC